MKDWDWWTIKGVAGFVMMFAGELSAVVVMLIARTPFVWPIIPCIVVGYIGWSWAYQFSPPTSDEQFYS